jgi:hypothetical protein
MGRYARSARLRVGPASLRTTVLALASLVALGCERGAPPGPSAEDPAPPSVLPLPESSLDAGEATDEPVAAGALRRDQPGGGAKLASIAMRTWIYATPDERGTKLGYLRAGAVIDRAEDSAGTDGCEGGWYHVSPRGYVCVGKGASLSLEHDVVQAALEGPHRDRELPYLYVFSASPAPHFYFRLPSDGDQRRVEGRTVRVHVAEHRERIEKSAGPPAEVPAFLSEGRALPKPYGAEKLLHYSVHAGRAKESSAFGLMTTFDWTGRRFGLTTELDLIALDRTKLARPSRVRGIALEHGGLPAFVKQEGVVSLAPDANGRLREAKTISRRIGFELTGKNQGNGSLVETTAGLWLPAAALLIAEPRKDLGGAAEAGRKWIDVSIRKQLLVAYEGTRPVFAALISSGRGGMSDPEETHATVRGTFYVRAKHVTATMDGEEASESFDLRDVPYIQYFHEGYALHGAYWHDDFGKPRSHGCINLAPADAKWLFDWSDPPVPEGWHGAVSAEGGTLVYVHG